MIMSRHKTNNNISSPIVLNEEEWRALSLAKEHELHEIHETRLRQLENAVSSKDQQIQALKRRFGHLKDDFDFNLKVILERDQELLDRDKSVESLKHQLLERQREIDGLKLTIQSSESSANRQEQDYDILSQKLSDARDNFESTIWNQEEEIQKRESKINELLTQLSSLESEFSLERSKIRDRRDEEVSKIFERQTVRESEYSDIVHNLETRLDDCKKEIVGYQSFIASRTFEFESRISELTNQVALKSETITELETQNSDLLSRISSTSSDMNRLLSSLSEVQSRAQSDYIKIDSRHTKLINELEDNIQAEKDDNLKLSTELSLCKVNSNQLATALLHVKQKLVEVKEKEREVGFQLSVLQAQLVQEHAVNGELNDELKGLRAKMMTMTMSNAAVVPPSSSVSVETQTIPVLLSSTSVQTSSSSSLDPVAMIQLSTSPRPSSQINIPNDDPFINPSSSSLMMPRTNYTPLSSLSPIPSPLKSFADLDAFQSSSSSSLVQKSSKSNIIIPPQQQQDEDDDDVVKENVMLKKAILGMRQDMEEMNNQKQQQHDDSGGNRMTPSANVWRRIDELTVELEHAQKEKLKLVELSNEITADFRKLKSRGDCILSEGKSSLQVESLIETVPPIKISHELNLEEAESPVKKEEVLDSLKKRQKNWSKPNNNNNNRRK